jgi:hypothetical protein
MKNTIVLFISSAIFGMAIPVSSKLQSAMYCYGARHNRNDTITPIYKPILESTKVGYILKFKLKNQNIIWNLNSKLIVSDAYSLDPKIPGGKNKWSLESYDQKPMILKPNGAFKLSLPVSERYWCEFDGKLSFGKNTKREIFK